MKLPSGLSEQVVRQISAIKHEPDWMLDIRLDAYREFCRLPLPDSGPYLSSIPFDKLCYFNTPVKAPTERWQKVPSEIKKIYQQIGLPEAEQRYLAGAQAQYNSGMVYESLHSNWQDSGIIFTDTDTAVQKYPQLVRQYFSKIVDYHNNKLAALNTAVWSGGSFIYIPPDVRLPIPLQAYFRINISNLGQFEHSIIIVDDRASLQYVEGCSAPIFNTDSLHNSIVEIHVSKYARMRYTAVQNWSTNVYNLVTSRMMVAEGGVGEWIDANIGSKITRKCPTIELNGSSARGDIMSLSTAKSGQIQDTGGRIIHQASNTSSTITSKSISSGSGVCTYHGNIIVEQLASNAKSATKCDSLLLDNSSVSNTFPVSQTSRPDAQISHEATVGRIDQAQLFYLMSRGLDQNEAISLMVGGFVEPITRTLPMEYASELNKLLDLSIKGAIGWHRELRLTQPAR